MLPLNLVPIIHIKENIKLNYERSFLSLPMLNKILNVNNWFKGLGILSEV